MKLTHNLKNLCNKKNINKEKNKNLNSINPDFSEEQQTSAKDLSINDINPKSQEEGNSLINDEENQENIKSENSEEKKR